MFNMGFGELMLILLVAFLFVGPKDLPKVAAAIGRLVRYLHALFSEFKEETGLAETMDALKETEKSLQKTLREADPTREIQKARRETQRALGEAKASAAAPPAPPKDAPKQRTPIDHPSP